MQVIDQSPAKKASLPKMRRAVSDYISAGKDSEPIFFYIDLDITRLINERLQTENPTSLTASIIWYWSKAIQEFPMFNSFIVGKKYMTFEQVDVSTMAEKSINGVNQALQYVLRDVNHRKLDDINKEIRSLKHMSYEELMPDLDRKFYKYAPKFVRKLLWWRVRKNPRLRKQFIGTTAVSNIGMFGSGKIYGRTPNVVGTGVLVMGTTYKQQVDSENGKKTLSYLCCTIGADHRLIDGAYGTRFITYFKSLIK